MPSVLIFGYGSIGRRHAKIIKKKYKNPDIYIVTNQEVKNFKKISIKDLKNINPQYIIISNITSKHLETIKIIEKHYRSKKVLIEKPLSDKYTNYVPRRNRYYVGYNLRFHPIITKLKNLIKGKELQTIDIDLATFYPNWRNTIQFDKSSSASMSKGGGAILDLSHEIDYSLFLFGPIKPIYSYNGKISNLPSNTDDYLKLIGKCTNREKTMYSLSINCFSRIEKREIRIIGNNLQIYADFINNRIKIEDHKVRKTFKFDHNSLTQSYIKQHNAILGSKKSNACDYSDGIEVLELIGKIRKINTYE